MSAVPAVPAVPAALLEYQVGETFVAVQGPLLQHIQPWLRGDRQGGCLIVPANRTSLPALRALGTQQHPKQAPWYLLDFDTMQQLNLGTGFRRAIRKRLLRKRQRTCEPCGDHTAPKKRWRRPREPCGNHTAPNKSKRAAVACPVPEGRSIEALPALPASICGPEHAYPHVFGPGARRALRRIKTLQVTDCPLVQQMRRLPPNRRLFEIMPIEETAPDFPAAQIQKLGRRRVLVHRVLPSTIWKRNHAGFDRLMREEKQFYKAYKSSDGKPTPVKHFAWHGAPAHNIKGILECGFLISQTPRVGNLFGHGVYLATEGCGQRSLNPVYSQFDSAGYQYLLLCEVLPGTVEPSARGQVRPSDLDCVHSGVDRLPSPSMHVFWSYDMNTRIRPKYLVCVPPPVDKELVERLRASPVIV